MILPLADKDGILQSNYFNFDNTLMIITYLIENNKWQIMKEGSIKPTASK